MVTCDAKGKAEDGYHVFNIQKNETPIQTTWGHTPYRICRCGISEPYYRAHPDNAKGSIL
jgi:hypothetical protein